MLGQSSEQWVISFQEFHNEIEKLFSGFGDLKSYVQAIAENKAKGKSLSLTSTTRTATREDTPEYVKDTETRVLNLFPINKYTEAVDWMLKQPVVQDLIYYETMRTVYRKLPVFKPESNFVIESFMDNTFSVRLQTHCGKATTRVSKADYGRFPLPMIALKIAQENLSNLGKLRVPGGKSVADFIKDRCANLRRTYLIGSDFMEGSDSVQEMAHRMLAERVDFVQNHKVSEIVIDIVENVLKICSFYSGSLTKSSNRNGHSPKSLRKLVSSSRDRRSVMTRVSMALPNPFLRKSSCSFSQTWTRARTLTIWTWPEALSKTSRSQASPSQPSQGVSGM